MEKIYTITNNTGLKDTVTVNNKKSDYEALDYYLDAWNLDSYDIIEDEIPGHYYVFINGKETAQDFYLEEM